MTGRCSTLSPATHTRANAGGGRRGCGNWGGGGRAVGEGWEGPEGGYSKTAQLPQPLTLETNLQAALCLETSTGVSVRVWKCSPHRHIHIKHTHTHHCLHPMFLQPQVVVFFVPNLNTALIFLFFFYMDSSLVLISVR